MQLSELSSSAKRYKITLYMYLTKSTKYKKVFYKKSNILLSTVIHTLTITLCSYWSQRLKIHNK